MDEQRINQVLMAYADKLPPMSIESLKSRILFSRLDENSLQILLMQMKDPTIALILSILTGTLGVDRFFIGDIGMGIGKLLTGGGCGIWWLIDIFPHHGRHAPEESRDADDASGLIAGQMLAAEALTQRQSFLVEPLQFLHVFFHPVHFEWSLRTDADDFPFILHLLNHL